MMSPFFTSCATAGAVLDPAVQRGLGLFEQGDVAVAGGLGGLGGELAGGRVEGGGDGDGDVLLRKGGVRVGGVPGFAQVRQVADRGGEGRDARHLGRRLGGQDGRAAVDARVAQPALGARHQADRRGGAAGAGELAGGEILAGGPGQGQVARGEFALVGQVEEGGQQRARLDGAGAAELGMASTCWTACSPSLAVTST
jgi:hypothetical protein